MWPVGNSMNFCYYCGRVVLEKEPRCTSTESEPKSSLASTARTKTSASEPSRENQPVLTS